MRIIYRVLAAVTLAVSTLSVRAATPANNERPTLVVGIVIDQLRTDYLELLQSKFSGRGFNRLINNGAYFKNVKYSVDVNDPTVSTAIIFTGAYPHINGISSSKIFDTKTQRPVPILTDHEKIGNFTDETFSPAAMQVSSMADEVRINGDALGYVYSLAPDAQQSIIMAGHAANSASWINDVTGFWATTTFYKDFPASLSFRNYNTSLATRLDTMRWQPLLPLDEYPDIPRFRKFYPFKYSFMRNDKDRFRKFKKSALVNEEVTNVAINYLQSLALGKRGELDMLNIAYTLAPYEQSIDRDFRIELEDAYLRLDQQIERLMNAIDATVGADNVLVFVASTGYFDDSRLDDEKFNIPTGEFHSARAKSLLNVYLMAIYGNGEWVLNYYDNHLFLNRNLIKERDLPLEEMRAKSAEFLRKMSGVAGAYTIDEIINDPNSPRANMLHRALNPAFAGDVIIAVKPGWQIVDPVFSPTKLVRDNSVNTPVIITGRDIPTVRIPEEIDVTFVAPTVSRILGIRSPNAAAHKPLIFN